MNIIALLVISAAALLSVGGNLTLRRALRGGGISFIVAGVALLACYGLAVNSVKWDFSSIMCVYIGFFALVHLLVRRFLLKETIPFSTWVGLALVLVGGLVIQFGRQ